MNATAVRCDVALTPAEIPGDLRNTTVVVIDVLRATTTIVYALANGARSVIPCEEPQDALKIREQVGREHVVLGGERDSIRIPDFDLDNSPLSYTRERVQDKTVVFTTTNGTRALRRAMQASAQAILCGAFVNLDALVGRLLETNASNALLACAGSEGAIALEDMLLAGAILKSLAASDPDMQLSDAARIAMLAYSGAASDLPSNVASAHHAQTLIHAGFADDVRLAAQIGIQSVVPIVRGEEIVAIGTPIGK